MKLKLAILLIAVAIVSVAVRRPGAVSTDGEWRVFGRDPGAQRFSPLTQITTKNVRALQPAWTFDTHVHDLQVTPIVVDGMMYVTGGSTVFALEPETGKPIWTYVASGAVSRRGVAYRQGDSTTSPRLFSGAGDGRMMALDARTGALVTVFGKDGFVDLKQSVRGDVDGQFKLITPPVVYKDIVITGGANEEGEPSTGLYGDIRGWDARTRQVALVVPHGSAAGRARCRDMGTTRAGKIDPGTNAWSFLTVDVERGLVFAPTGSPTSDFYGGDRNGQNLYGNSLIALDAATGRLKWFHQLVHHDIWDWDLPAAPTLIEVTKNGRRIPAVAQITKMSTLFIFDRVTGEPLFGLEERPVPQSDVPGEATWPTQPFPTAPPPLSRTTFDPATDFYTLTPEHAAYCRELWNANAMYTKGMFTPPVARSNNGDVPEHAGRRQLERPVVRRRARTGIHEHHEPGPGGANGAAHRQQSRRGHLSPYAPPWGRPIGRFWNPENRCPAPRRRSASSSRLTSTAAPSGGVCRSACSTI